MSYEPLLKRIAELRAAASLERPLCACGEDCLNGAANKALAAPAHEYAACVEALVEAQQLEELHHCMPEDHTEFCAKWSERLDALAKVML